MANKINLTLKVNDDGSLDITAKKAKKAAQETEKLGNATNKAAAARNRYNKGEKGVAQAGMNSTKAFSKMRNEMGGGSSGLVVTVLLFPDPKNYSDESKIWFLETLKIFTFGDLWG